MLDDLDLDFDAENGDDFEEFETSNPQDLTI